MLPATMVLVLGFFAILHSWLNAFAEMTRFADRMFYKVCKNYHVSPNSANKYHFFWFVSKNWTERPHVFPWDVFDAQTLINMPLVECL